MNAARLLALSAALTLAATLAPMPSPAQLGGASARKPLGVVKAAQADQRRLAAVDPLPCPSSSGPPGVSFRGRTLTNANFTRRSLVNADFSNAVIDGSLFIAANLTGANFSGARFVGSNARFPNDFTFANLKNACFQGATFESRVAYTYFSYAVDLTGADFSSTDLGSAPIAFGPRPLNFDPAIARPRFRNATMSCEFVAQWKDMDLSGAKLQECGLKLRGVDFSNAVLAGADFSNADLSDTKWNGASLANAIFKGAVLDGATGLNGAANTDLTQAQFHLASARYLDFSGAKLNGAVFSNADLEGTDFGGASLSDTSLGAASFDGAHLKNVSFVGTNLNGVSFQNASVYGSAIGAPPQSCALAAATCPASYPRTGATCSCASMSGANLTLTDFTGAFLYGVDFSTAATIVNGTDFTNAVLVAANFKDATFKVDASSGGVAPKFDSAWLQGAQLPAANLNGVSLAGAFVDFEPNGNRLYVKLTGKSAGFPNWSGSAAPCVRLSYDGPSTLPIAVGTMTCPDGNKYPAGCGALLPREPKPNPAWKGGSVTGNSPVPGWYRVDSTYDAAALPPAACSAAGGSDNSLWFAANPSK